MKTKTLAAVVTSLALGASLTACSSQDRAAAEPNADGNITLNVGTIGIASDAAINTAIEKGYFADEGLEVKTTVVANPPAGIAAAQSGQLDLAYTPSIPLINAMSQSVDLKVVGPADGYDAAALKDEAPAKVDDTGLFVRPNSGISRAKDLEGRKVAVPARKAQLEVTIANMVSKDGGDPSKINWMVLDPASSLQSLQQSRVDAAGLVAPFSTNAGAEGMELLGSPGLEFFGPGAVGLWVAGSEKVEQNPEAMAGFQRAIVKANAYANEHQEEMEKKAAKITGIDEQTISTGADNYWPSEVALDDLTHVDEQLVQLGYLPKGVDLDDSVIFSAN